MMSATQNSTIRQALRKYLQEGTGSPGMADDAANQEVMDLAGELARFSSAVGYFPPFKALGGDAKRPVGDEGASCTFVYKSGETGGFAGIRLSSNLISDMFFAALGGTQAAGRAPAAALTPAESQFATLLAMELEPVVSAVVRSAVFEKVDYTGSEPEPGVSGNMHTHVFAAEFAGRTVFIEVDISKVRESNSPSKKSSTLATAAQKVAFAPQVRIRLKPMMVAELAGLRRGDVITAELVAGNLPANLYIEGKPVLDCEMGQVGNRYSVRIKGPAAVDPALAGTVFSEGGR